MMLRLWARCPQTFAIDLYPFYFTFRDILNLESSKVDVFSLYRICALLFRRRFFVGRRIYLFVVHLTMISVVSNVTVMHEWWITKDMGRSNRSLFKYTTPELAWRNWENDEKHQSIQAESRPGFCLGTSRTELRSVQPVLTCRITDEITN
jgi:hypothetical protein